MMGWYNDTTTGYGWLMAGLMLVMIVAVVIGVWLVLRSGRHDESASASPTARSVLDRRLAAGEIDAEQYGRLRWLMEDGGVAAPPGGGARR